MSLCLSLYALDGLDGRHQDGWGRHLRDLGDAEDEP